MALLLYKKLKSTKNSSLEELERNHRLLAYSYAKDGDMENLKEINTAIQILQDPYKKSFYNIFGDDSMKWLSNPTESMLLTRFLTKTNVFLFSAFLVCFFTNYFFLGWFFLFFKNAIYNYILFIISPFFLLLISFNVSHTLSLANHNVVAFNKAVMLLMSLSCSVLCILIKLPYYYLICTEVIQLMIIGYFYRTIPVIGTSMVKSVSLGVFFMSYSFLKYFMPCYPVVFAMVFEPVMAGIAVIFLLFMCSGLYLTNCTSYIKIGYFINILLSSLGFILFISCALWITSLVVKSFDGITDHILIDEKSVV